MGIIRRLTVILALACLALAMPAAAVWPHDTDENVPICNAASTQYDAVPISDGAGGAIIVWRDVDIYAQRIDSTGAVQWATDGVPVCTATGNQWYFDAVSDGAGGVIVVWEDQRSIRDIYAQRIDASGTALWTTDGVLICGASGSQYKPWLDEDGAGGAVIAWQDNRTGGPDIYAQRVDADGNAMWVADGVEVCTDASAQYEPHIASDGSGGAYIAWADFRGGTDYDVYAQRIFYSGTPSLATNGLPVCTATGHQNLVRVMADGLGGAVVSWMDTRAGGETNIYAQRINQDGDAFWTADGLAVCTDAAGQANHRAASDGAGGVIFAWQDNRGGTSDDDIYAQRISAYGVVEWMVDGVLVCGAPRYQFWPRIAPNGLGGAIITWPDHRSGVNSQVFAQMIDDSGAVQWQTDGVGICTIPGAKDSEIVSDGAGGALVCWEDARNSATTGGDIYAQKIERNGFLGYPCADLTAAVDHPDDQGDQIILDWDASYLDAWPLSSVDSYSVWRRYGGTGARAVATERPMNATPEMLEERGWMHVADISALQLPEYGHVVPSFGDSTEAGIIWTDMMVLAHSSALGENWSSEVITAYSVDNLAPGAPAALAAEALSPDIALVWSPSGYLDEDLSVYNVYRSDVSGFVADETTFVEAVTDTVYADLSPGAGTWYYVVAAEDVHGNEGDASNEASATLGTGVGDPMLPTAFALRGNSPNPFNPTTRIAFDLPESGRVKLEVYTASGRLVTTLADRAFEAGSHEQVWDGRNDIGHGLPSGVYLLRVTAGSEVATHAMVLLK